MTRKSKREIERKVEELQPDQEARQELLAGAPLTQADEPALTELLVDRGYLVEREERQAPNGWESVFLHKTPAFPDLSHSLQWHFDGPTANLDHVRIQWDSARLEDQIAAADHPVAEEDVAPRGGLIRLLSTASNGGSIEVVDRERSLWSVDGDLYHIPEETLEKIRGEGRR